ncbi:PREDICTED: equilibrative nucleoside transporter 4-like [Cyprinodon variegatus]|uniref:equilibrative nucleoside transporter 4-like n=1 Tax=Cyprinodon variegatus TaxID=28743 RepID=UPI000742C964|nr:PREDICTED: equilibrative nucleoside transporter 4-like [Cyprinodon variegatus]
MHSSRTEMGSVGAERRRPTPAQTPEEWDGWRDRGMAGWRDPGREGWREGRESGVVQSYSFDSYQLEEEEISKDAPERGVLALSEPEFEQPIPDDRYHGIYFAMLLAGVGFLLPYNSFITDVDYLHCKFQGTPIVFDMSLTYIVVALLAVILNNVLVERLSMHTRITVGYILALGPLIFVSVFDVWLEMFTNKQAYVINLVSVGVVAFGCTGRLFLKGNGGTAAPASAEEGQEDFVGGTYVRFDAPKAKMRKSWPGVRDMILHRYVVSRVIWAYMLSIAVTYSITLCLFPGLESEIRNNTLGEWLPILIMATFNMSDFVGKILAALPYDWSGGRLLFFSCLRVVFIPLFVLCVYPVGAPMLSHPAWPCLFSLLMGVTNGYFGSVPMIQAAGKVPPEQRELAGNTMTVSYMTGLMVGSSVAYATYSFNPTAAGACPPPHAPFNATGY